MVFMPLCISSQPEASLACVINRICRSNGNGGCLPRPDKNRQYCFCLGLLLLLSLGRSQPPCHEAIQRFLTEKPIWRETSLPTMREPWLTFPGHCGPADCDLRREILSQKHPMKQLPNLYGRNHGRCH